MLDYEELFKEARARINDLLMEEDGFAAKEARKFLERTEGYA